MRSSDGSGGRFHIGYEERSIRSGIGEDLQRPVGQNVLWYRFDSAASEIDPVYDVGDYQGGRRWKEPPLLIPAVMAVVYQGQTFQNESGLYQADILRVTLNDADVDIFLPGFRKHPDDYLRDRIVYQNGVYSPTRLYLRGHVSTYINIVTLDANQVNSEELVNDPQFQQFAT